MTDPSKAFRDYATRVSFNLSLSRNQIANLRSIVFQIENDDLRTKLGFDEFAKAERAADCDSGSNFIVGKRSLESMGLIEDDPRAVAENRRLDEAEKAGIRRQRNYWGPMWRLTPAGDHVVGLLQLAGLMPVFRAANANKRKRRAS